MNAVSFGLDLTFRYLPGKRRSGRQLVALTAPFTWGDITVPAGYETDFASVPNWADGLCPVFDSYAPAAVIHDYAYTMGGKIPNGPTLTRKEADDLFLSIMATLGIPWWKRSIMYRAVRIGGGSGWAAA